MQLIAFTATRLACSIVRDYTAMIHESSTRLRFPSLYIFSFCGWLPFFDAYTKSISSAGMIGLGSFLHMTELQEGWLRKSLDSGRFCIRWYNVGGEESGSFDSEQGMGVVMVLRTNTTMRKEVSAVWKMRPRLSSNRWRVEDGMY